MPWAPAGMVVMAETGFRLLLLGPLEAQVNGTMVAVPAGRPAVVLAVLGLAGGRPVATETLADRVWGDQLPKRVRPSLASLVLRLRKSVGDGVIRTVPPGYLLNAAPEQIDLLQFRGLVRQAAAADPVAARGLLDEALGLWRGEPLAGIRSEGLERELPRLAEEWVGAMQARIGLDLASGRHAEAVEPLRDLVVRHPLREPFWQQLITALVGAGRHAEALEAYTEVRVRLREELGVDPSADLQRLHQAILTGTAAGPDVGPARPAGSVTAPVEYRQPGPAAVPEPSDRAHRRRPAQLPAEAAGFIGRVREVQQLDGLLGGAGAARTPALVAVITGTAGVGKTALALRWAHRVAGRFPDGSLYVDLNGFASTPPVPPIEALGRLLRALGLTGDQIPADVEDAAGLYRTLLAGTRTLVVLDNAAHPDQVRPLLPGSGSCFALVTSRDRLSGLVARNGARRQPLDVLAPAEAVELLGRLVGADTVRSEADAVGELARQCGYLPLALRIAAANLTEHPHQTVAGYTFELAKGRLAALEVAGDEQAAVRAAFDQSYAALPALARRLFRLLGLVPGQDLDVAAAAALAGDSAELAASLLTRLVTAHLVEQRAAGRYGFHDLLRLYAAERADQEDDEAYRDAALGRLLDYYIARVTAAAAVLYPTTLRLPPPTTAPAAAPPPTAGDGTAGDGTAGDGTAGDGTAGDGTAGDGTAGDPAAGDPAAGDPVTWLDTERPNLVAAVRHAAEHGPRPAAWRLADLLRMYFYLRMHLADWEAVATDGLTAASADGDVWAQAAGHLSLALLRARQIRTEPAADHYATALRLTREAGWLEGEATALNNLGLVHAAVGRLRLATDCYDQALAIQRQLNQPSGTAAALGNLASLYFELGCLNLAADYDQQAISLYRTAGHRVGEAVVLAEHGETCRALGRLDAARDLLDRSLALSRELGNRVCEAESLHRLGSVWLDAGRYADADRFGHAALDLSREVNHRGLQVSALGVLAAVRAGRGEPAAAADLYQQAIEMTRDDGNQYREAELYCRLAVVRSQLGNAVRAAADAEYAGVLARRGEYRVVEGHALTALAAIRLRQADHTGAAEDARRAVQTYRRAGHRLGEARALVVLSRALHRSGRTTPARQQWALALTIFTSCGAPPAGPDHMAALPG
jgi:DNA-binding SARP family transcriptional activator/tetratricopeptide (TPR) repeat protein